MEMEGRLADKQSRQSKKDGKIPPQRYNESKNTRQFLNSRNGISFLLDSQEQQSRTGGKQGKNLLQKVDDLIDFYTAWASSFPVRKNLKVSKYEFLKSIENFCSKNETKQDFESLLGL